ncbi:MAG TPA: hypothetical protein VHQ64_19410 [Pyrinomonadaceae bacterium]|jgi:hypothetical protein|nr:hypothetical protein [Pyrinomonadaceae bacterium]
MCSLSGSARFVLSVMTFLTFVGVAAGQRQADQEFGPVVTAYLGYLNNEQEVVDDRASRREITPGYYRRNSNRIHALRQTALRLVRQSGNDYVPELEAVTTDEFKTIFERPPLPVTLRVNEVFGNKFRFLGSLHSGETFYVFARLDPYEQADLIQRTAKSPGGNAVSDNGAGNLMSTRARRVVPR